MQTTFRRPPTYRDLQIYQAITTDGLSTRFVADQHGISQTRVRQVVRRVLDWVAETLPAETEVEQQNRLRVAQCIAADRMQLLYGDLMEQWRQKHEARIFGQILRLTLASSQLMASAGLIDAMVADAIEGPLEEEVECRKSNVESRSLPTDESAANPLVEECSPQVADPPPDARSSAEAEARTSSADEACAETIVPSNTIPKPAPAAHRPLLTASQQQAINSLWIGPDAPGAVNLDTICRRLEEKKRSTPRRVAQ